MKGKEKQGLVDVWNGVDEVQDSTLVVEGCCSMSWTSHGQLQLAWPAVGLLRANGLPRLAAAVQQLAGRDRELAGAPHMAQRGYDLLQQ